ncbi:MAG: cytochrome c [Anaerolineales bacterium]|nr:cytochrome c [Anaerolineales bacterium]
MSRRTSPRAVALGFGFVGLLTAAFLLWSGAEGNATQGPVTINGTTVSPVPTLSAERVAAGEGLYAQSCAACHGAALEGAPNWKVRLANGSLPPPPHDATGHTWHHADEQLLSIVVQGGDPAYNGVMPGFAASLTIEQMTATLDFIKSRWGSREREYQWWITVTRRGQP